jgi:hypothetical protein
LYTAESVLKNTIKNINGNRQRGNQRGSVGVVHECKIKTIHISGPMVQSEALALAKSLGNEQVKASTEWLGSFKKRHNIVWNGVCGESKDLDESVVSEYKPKLLELNSPYEPKNIYSPDETGFFLGITNKITRN